MVGSRGPKLTALLVLLAMAVPVLTTECPIVMQINPAENTSPDCQGELTSGQEYQIPSMECALSMIARSDLSENENGTVCIQLAAGEHTISYSDRIIFSDIVINATGAATLTCTTEVDEEFLSQGGYKTFPIHVSGQATVEIHGVIFKGCARPLLFNGTERVVLEDSSFSDFTESAIEIYNTPLVTISNCSFTNNTSNGISPTRNSGNAGALSIGFNETFRSNTTPRIVMQDSNFTGNLANGTRPCEREITTVLFSKVYVNRGGAFDAYFSAPAIESSLTVERCQFINNTAGDLGGVAYINLSGENDSVTEIAFKKCNFSGNSASILGGGIQITVQTISTNPILFQDCSFTNNTAGELGGAIKALQFHTQGNLDGLRIERTSFVGNNATVGAALHIQSPFLNTLQYYSPESSANRATIKDCSFIENYGKDIIYNDHNQLNFTGSNVFRRNTGSSIRVEGSLLSFKGSLMFESNTAHPEGVSGTLYLSSFAEILLNENVSVSFLNNSGSEGAAIVVRYPTVSISFGRTLFNTECFLQFANHTAPPVEWSNYNVSLEFSGNQADIGPVLFVTSLDACSWFSYSDGYFNTNITETWDFMTARDNYVNRNGMMCDIPELYIQTEVQEIQISTLHPECEAGINANVCAYPGEEIRLNVSTLDENNQSTSAFLRIVPNTEGTEFSPSIVQSNTTNDTISISYSGLGTFTTTDVKVEASFSSAMPSTAEFTVFHMECLPGFRLDETLPPRNVCKCAVDIREVLSCDPDMRFVLLKEGTWGASANWSRTLVTHTCPPGYCNCTGSPNEKSTVGCALIYSKPNVTCTPKRTGVLCGQCKEPYGVGMLTMECQKFTAKYPMYYWLMPLLIIFIVVAVVVIVKAGVAMPSVLMGFLFYIQITAIAVAYIDENFKLVPAIMDCFHSLLALYVPYNFTLHRGLTALEAYGLKFIPPVLVLILAPIVMRIKYKSKSWRGVWTLVLLMYAMTVQTSASLLFCPTFTRNTMNGTTESITVWFFDGSVTCYQGIHLALSIVAVIFLIISGLFIPISVGIVYQKQLRKKIAYFDRHHFEKISKAFTDPYKEVHKWWAPFELIRRYVIIITLIFWPGYMTLSVSLIGGVLVIQWFIQPYKHWWTNLAEAFSVLVLTVVICFGDTNSFVIHATGTKNFVLFPLLYFPLVVGIICNYSMLGWKIWIGIKKARSWWQRRATEKALAKREHKRTSTITTNIYKRMSTQTISFDDCKEGEDDSSIL